MAAALAVALLMPLVMAVTAGLGAAPAGAAAPPGPNSVVAFGSAAWVPGAGSTTALPGPVTGIAATPDGNGYWTVTATGQVTADGDAGNFGSLPAGASLNAPILGITATADGKGYWLVGADGGIFSFGDATFYGSTGSMALNRPVVGMAAVPGGGGYWLVASDGGIFAFGNAPFYGSTGSMALNRPVVGMAAVPGGRGLLAGGLRRRRLLVRQRPVLRLDRDNVAGPAGHRHGGHTERPGLLDGGRRRRHLQLRQRRLRRLGLRRVAYRAGGGHRRPARGLLGGLRPDGGLEHRRSGSPSCWPGSATCPSAGRRWASPGSGRTTRPSWPACGHRTTTTTC